VYEFLSSAEHKKNDIFKNVSSQKVNGPHWLS